MSSSRRTHGCRKKQSRRRHRHGFKPIDSLFCELLESKQLLAADVAVQFSDLVLDTTDATTVAIEGKFEDTGVSGTVVKFETNAPLASNDFYVELTSNTPLTNANFLSYVNSGAYDNSIFHRSVSNFILQGGAFSAPTTAADSPGSEPVAIPTTGTVQNEPGNPNIRGTIAMAKSAGQTDSATSQFFFNLDTNSFLDSDNGGYTVFGEVLGSGMTVVDTMSSTVIYDASTYYSNAALSGLPLWNVNQDNIIRPQDFVKIENADAVTESALFTYSSSSSDPAKLTASFNGNGDLVLTPVGNATGSVDVTVTATSKLDNSTANDTFSVTLEVDSVNDAPVLDPAASPQLSAINEGAGVPVGQVGTLVSDLIDVGGTHNNFSDIDGDLPGIAITGVNLQGGSLWFSTDDGVTWFDVGLVSDEAPRLLLANVTTRLYFKPAADFHGSISDVMTLRAWDRSDAWVQFGSDIDGEAAGDSSGWSVSLSNDGNTVAIGAIHNGVPHSHIGHVRIYAWNGAAWVKKGSDIDGRNWSDNDGWSVSLSSDGQTVALSSYAHDWGRGRVRVYQWDGSDWGQLGIDLIGVAADDDCGRSMSLSSDGLTVAIGSQDHDSNGVDSGHVRIYQYVSDSWTQLGNDIDGESAGDKFGSSVSLSGDGETVAIAARYGNADDSGHTRIYQWNGLTWLQIGDDINGQAENDSNMPAIELSNDGQRVAIRARWFSGDGDGKVRIYELVDSSWIQVGSDIPGAAPLAGGNSVSTVSLSADGSTVAIGSRYGNIDNSGIIRLHQWDGITWSQVGSDIYGEGASDESGHSISLSSDGRVVAIGARLNDGNGEGAGHVRIHRLVPSLSLVSDTVSIGVTPVNDPPTLDALSAVNMNEDDPEQTVNLTGITAGGGETQVLSVTAVSDNTGLIPDPTVNYISPDSTGLLAFTPVADQHGTATITVTVEDGGFDNNLATPGDNETFSQTFTVNVAPVNDNGADVGVPFSDQVISSSGPITVSVEGVFEDTKVSGTVVKFETNAPLADNDFYVELTGNTPFTNANFLSYVNSGAYDNSMFHRSVSNFVIQGGGFEAPTIAADQPGSDPIAIPTTGTVQNEPGNLNTRGTIAMAKLGDLPDSATNQFFFNMADNEFLDTQNGGFTAFGDVLGSGMTVVDAIGSTLTYDASAYYSNTALSELPLWNVNQDNIILPNDFVKIENADVVTESALFTYSASSSDPAKLTASFNGNGDLVLTPVGDATDTVNVTVVATSSLDNSTATDTFSVTLEVDSVPFSVTSSEHGIDLDDSKPTITGFGTPAASIEVFADLNRDGTAETSIGTTTVASDNSWSLTSDEWLPGGPVNVSATQDTGDPELLTADGIVTVRSTRPGPLVEFGTNLLADGYINAAEAASNITLRSPFDGSNVSSGKSFWVATDTGGNKTFVLTTVGSTAQANNYKDVGFSADLFREGGQVIDATFLPQGGWARNAIFLTKDTIAPEATLGISDVSIFPNETATVSITLSEDVNGLDVTDFVVSGGTLTNLSGDSLNLTATFTPDVDFSGTATISIASDTFTDVAGNPNESSGVTLNVIVPFSVTSSEHGIDLDDSKPTIAGFGTPGASIEVFADLNRDGTAETSIGTTTVASDNSWSLTSDEWLPGGPVNVSATQGTGDSELSTADGVVTVRTNRPGPLVEFGTNLLTDGYINAAEVASNIVLRTPFDGSMISAGNSLWVFTDTGGNKTFVLQTVGSTAQANNYKDVGFSADLLREGVQTIDAWFTPTSSGGKAREVISVTKDTIAPEATLGISDASIFPNETATVSITLSEDVSGLGIEDFSVTGGILTNLSGVALNLTATFTPDVGFIGTAMISIASDAFTDVAGNPNSESSDVTLEVDLVNDVPTLNVIGHISVDEDNPTLAIGFSGITAGGNDTQELKITASSGSIELIPDPVVAYTSPNTVGSLTFTPVADQHGTATITLTVEDSGIDGDLNTTEDNLTLSRTFAVTVTPVNDAPTLDALSEVNILDDPTEQTVSLTGITAGGGENQLLSITAVSDNTGLIPDPTVDFDGQSSVGSLRFTPVADQSGTATITVTVEDGGLDNDLGTPEDNGSILRTVIVKVDPVNDAPTLDPVSDLILSENSLTQVLDITGITAGGGENQPIQVTTSNSDASLVLDPTLTTRSALGVETRLLTVTPLPDQYGIATITVTVEDGGLDLDLDTAEDNATFSQTFDITVTPDTDNPPLLITPHGRMFIHETLSGDSLVSYQLPAVNVNGEAINGLFNRITATSSDTALIPDPTVLYASADVPSSLSFTPVANANGTTTLSIQVEDGGSDNDFATTEDNRQATHQVEVNVLEVISNQGSAILAKDGTENLYVNTQPVVYHEQQAQSTIAGFAAIGATSQGGENALLVERSSVRNRLVTDDTWRINGLFDSLQNESSPVLDLSAREVSSTLNVAAISGAYEINGVNNPTLIVRRGQAYTFNLNAAGHPFYLQATGNGYESENTYSGGFTGNGQTSGEHEWVVPQDAPDEIFYQCEFHPVMFGKIIVVD